MTGYSLPTFIPPDVDMPVVKAEVAATGVSAPAAAVPGLLDVVHQARAEGVDLKIVLLDHNPSTDTPLRDISTVVGSDYHDVTVLTLSPSYVGSYSTHYPRVTLEAGEDHSKTGNPVVSAQNFLYGLTAPEFPWTALTLILVLGVVLAAAGARVLGRVASDSAMPETAAVAGSEGSGRSA